MAKTTGLVAVVVTLTAMGCSSGPKVQRIKLMDGCTQQQAALVWDAAKAWNTACGDTVFRPADDDDSLGDVRVLCADVEDFGDAGIIGPGVVKAYYSSGLRRLTIPRVLTARDVEMGPALVTHELGHHLIGGIHRDEDPISIMRSFYTPGVALPSEGDVRALREAGWDCWANGRTEGKLTVQKPLADR